MPPRAADAVLVGVGVFGLLHQQQVVDGTIGPTWQAVLFAVVTPQLLWWRRSHPTTVHLAVVLLTSAVPLVVLAGAGFVNNNGLLLAMPALFAVGCYEGRPAARRVVLAATAVVVSLPYAFLPPSMRRSPRNGCGWPVSCTTRSPTTPR